MSQVWYVGINIFLVTGMVCYRHGENISTFNIFFFLLFNDKNYSLHIL